VPIAVTRTETTPRVVLVRGQQLNPWDAAQYVPLRDRFGVVALNTPSNWFDVGEVQLPMVKVRTRRDRLPKGRVGDVLTDRFVNRYEHPEAVLGGAAIVHPQELTTWYSRQTALLKPKTASVIDTAAPQAGQRNASRMAAGLRSTWRERSRRFAPRMRGGRYPVVGPTPVLLVEARAA